jgi:hypothetical protein
VGSVVIPLIDTARIINAITSTEKEALRVFHFMYGNEEEWTDAQTKEYKEVMKPLIEAEAIVNVLQGQLDRKWRKE